MGWVDNGGNGSGGGGGGGTPGGGTVTTVGLSLPADIAVSNSPVTSAGTLTGTRVAQPAGQSLLGPVSGAAAVPTYRNLVASDLPSIPAGQVTGLAASATTDTTNATNITSGSLALARLAASSATNGQVLTFNGTSYAPATLPAGSGTVSSVALSLPGDFSVSGSPITSSGTITAFRVTQPSNQVLASAPSGPAAQPAYRSLVAADIPNLPASQVTGLAASATTDTTNATNISTGALALARLSTATATTGQVLTFNGTSYVPQTPAASATGTVTSVALAAPSDLTVTGSPITSAGTLTLGRTAQAAGVVFAGPTTGAAAVPTYRALVPSDLPTGIPPANLATTGATTGQALIFNGTSYAPATVSSGSGGTVTSVALAAPSDLAVTGSPITGAGTLTLTRTAQSAGTVMAGPATGAAAVPTYRALAATDLPTIPAAQVSGLAPSATTDTTNASNITSGALALPRLASGGATTGQVLAFNGTSYAPTTPAAGSTGTVTSVAMTVPAGLSVAGSPITSSGTLAVTRTAQPANQVLASPTSGAAAAPTYRSLVAADIPSGIPPANLATTGATTGQVLAFNGTAYAPASVAGTGTVTSVAMTVPSDLTVTGSPITGSGTLALTRVSQPANTFLGGPVITPEGAPAPTFRALDPLDIPSGIPIAKVTGIPLNDRYFLFGDGSDGLVTLGTTVTLTRDMYYNNLTLAAGGTLRTNGFKIYVSGTLDLTAATFNAIVGLNAASGSVGSGGAGGAGGATTTTTGGNGSAPAVVPAMRGGQGGGGSSGGAGVGGAGGGGGSVVNTPIFAINRPGVPLLFGASLLTGGTGGAGGGGAGGSGLASGPVAGAGGQGGGVVYIAANVINRGAATAAGCINAIGQNGQNGGGNVANAGGGGAGGGGGGGWVYIVAGSLTGAAATNTIDVSGGNGGAGGTAGAGGTGAPGAQSGNGGTVQVFNLATGVNSVLSGAGVNNGSANVGVTGGAGGIAPVVRVNL